MNNSIGLHNVFRMRRAVHWVTDLLWTPLFNAPSKLSKVVELDLKCADIHKVDERGRVVDVHALRHTFETHLSKAGVPLRTAQAAMRHSTPLLTANVYTDPALLDVGVALDALPELPLGGPQVAKNIAAAGDQSSRVLAPTLALTSGNGCHLGSSADKMGGERTEDGGRGGDTKTPVNRGDCHRVSRVDNEVEWWAVLDSNQWPPACKAGALTN